MFRRRELVQRRRRREKPCVHVVLRGLGGPMDDSDDPIVPKNVDFIYTVWQRVQERCLEFDVHDFAHALFGGARRLTNLISNVCHQRKTKAWEGTAFLPFVSVPKKFCRNDQIWSLGHKPGSSWIAEFECFRLLAHVSDQPQHGTFGSFCFISFSTLTF